MEEMKKWEQWEHKEVYLLDSDNVVDVANVQGDDGWQLIGFEKQFDGSRILYFKRPKQEAVPKNRVAGFHGRADSRTNAAN